MIDIEPVDLLDVDYTHAPGGDARDPLIERLPRLRAQLLGIVDAARHTTPIEDDRGGDDRPRQWTAARLVDADGGLGMIALETKTG